MLNITDDEMKQMKTLINKKEKLRRDYEAQKKKRRNEEGLTTKEEQKKKRVEEIIKLQEAG